jgi:hypothetical protein
MSLASRERHRHWPRRLTLALCLLAAPAFAQAAPAPDPGAPLPYVIGLHEAYLTRSTGPRAWTTPMRRSWTAPDRGTERADAGAGQPHPGHRRIASPA